MYQLIPHAFECLQSLCEGWINEQERYYYFNRRHQEIKPCGRLCEWREEVRVTVCLCVCMCIHLHVSVNVCMYICRRVSLCVRLYETGEGQSWYTKTGDWGVDQRRKRKDIHVCILTHLRESLCDFVRVCASDCLWSQRKRDLYFRAYALFSRTHTSTGLNISIMNCDYTLLGTDREESYLFIYFTKHTHSKAQANVHYLSSNITAWPLVAHPCDWNHHAGAPKLWPPWKWTWSLNLSPATPPSHMVR